MALDQVGGDYPSGLAVKTTKTQQFDTNTHTHTNQRSRIKSCQSAAPLVEASGCCLRRLPKASRPVPAAWRVCCLLLQLACQMLLVPSQQRALQKEQAL